MDKQIVCKHLNITLWEGCLIYAFDLGYLLSDPWSAGNMAERVKDDWLLNISQKLSNWEKYGFSSPEFAESEYGKTDRAPRNTFAKRHAKRLLPLILPFKKPAKFTEKNLTFYPENIKISPQGAVSIRIIFELGENNNLSTSEIISDYNHMLTKTPAIIRSSINKFIEYWNSSGINTTLNVPSYELLEEVIHTYEIVDFDFNLIENQEISRVTSVKRLYKDDDIVPACELAAISRMSPVSAQALNDVRLFEFIDTDIGGRDDELWAINRDRTIRCHPDRKSIYNRAFLADIKMASEILICEKATFDFLEDWVGRRRKGLLDQILFHSDLSRQEKDISQEQFGEVMRVTQLLIEPIMIQKDVRHAFYIQSISKLIDCLGLKESNERSSKALRDFAQLIESVSGYNNAELATHLSNLQVQLAKSAERLGLVTIIITIIGVILAFVQIYIAFIK